MTELLTSGPVIAIITILIFVGLGMGLQYLDKE